MKQSRVLVRAVQTGTSIELWVCVIEAAGNWFLDASASRTDHHSSGHSSQLARSTD